MQSIAVISLIKVIGFLVIASVFCSVYGIRALVTRETERKEVGSGTRELMKLIQKDEEILREYNWMNKDSGVVSIPVRRAMELMLQEPASGTETGEADTAAAASADNKGNAVEEGADSK